MAPGARGLRALVTEMAVPRAEAPARDESRLLNINEARALMPTPPAGKGWSDWWMRTRCAPKAKVRFGGRVYWREAGLRAWLATLAQEPTP